MPDIATPCIKICALEPTSGLCFGCGRNAEEIASWSSYTERERARITARLPERLATLHGCSKAKFETP
jgi:predicted Fe-S protein YdhL (DUF1289 family)